MLVRRLLFGNGAGLRTYFLVVHHVYDPSQQCDEIFTGQSIITSSKQRPLAPIHGQQYPCPQTHALCKVHAPPEVYCHQAATETQSIEVKDGRVADVCQTTQMMILKRFVDSFI